MDQMADKTNQLLANNLQHLKRHARMGVKIGKMRKHYANSEQHKRHVHQKIDQLKQQEKKVDKYMDKILGLRKAEEYEGIGDREGQRKLAGLFVACQMSQVILERTKGLEEMDQTTSQITDKRDVDFSHLQSKRHNKRSSSLGLKRRQTVKLDFK